MSVKQLEIGSLPTYNEIILKVCHIFSVPSSITRNLTVIDEITPLYDILESISTMIRYVQPFF